FFFQAEDGIRDFHVTGVQTCALPISSPIAEIVDNSQLHLDLQVFEQDLPKIKVGQLITFAITNNPAVNYSAKVYNIGSSFQDARSEERRVGTEARSRASAEK